MTTIHQLIAILSLMAVEETARMHRAAIRLHRRVMGVPSA